MNGGLARKKGAMEARSSSRTQPSATRDLASVGQTPFEVYACAKCPRVARQLFRVRWSDGPLDFEPAALCHICVDALRRLEHEHAVGRSLDTAIWGIEVLETLGTDESAGQQGRSRSRRGPIARDEPRRRRGLGGVGV